MCWHGSPATEYLPWGALCWPAQAGKQQKGDSRRGSRAPSVLARIACESDSRGMVRGRMMASATRAPEHRRVWLQQAALAPFLALAADVALA